MKDYSVDKIRNVVLMSHGGAGKTTFTEAMLYNAKATDRFGKVADGNTVSDYDAEEIKRKISISTTVTPCEYKDCKINIIDTPGYFDFVGEVMSGVRVADSAFILVSGKSGVEVGTEKAWKYAVDRDLARAFFINELDDENADFEKVATQISEVFGKQVVPFQIPILENGKMIGIVDVLNREGLKFEDNGVSVIPIPSDIEGALDALWERINEAIADTDDELMEKFFAGEEYTEEEVTKGIKDGVKQGALIPIFGGSAYRNWGVIEGMRAICKYMPSPLDRPDEVATKAGSDDTVKLTPDPAGPLAALVYKTVADPFVGRISFVKVYSGTLKSDSTVYNSVSGKPEKIATLFGMLGKKQINVAAATAGDLVAVAKLQATSTNDTLCDQSNPLVIDGVQFPEPVYSMAVAPKTKGDEEKINSGLVRLMDEDKTMKLESNHETHQQVLSGIGDQHLDVIVSKLRNKFKVEVELEDVRVPYRETIRKRVEVEGKHKKQSGGHGQYGHVKMVFEHGESEGLTFEETIFGGSVPKQYFPAVEKGLQECILHGVLAGYPVVNLKATLIDGSYHDVDSSEMAFKLAAHLAYKKGLPDAAPVILEPIASVQVFVAEQYMGDIIGDLNKRRGRVMGMTPLDDGTQQIDAEVPMAEMFKYATDLRSMTQGRGSFSFEFARYEEAPANVAEKIIADSKALMADDE